MSYKAETVSYINGPEAAVLTMVTVKNLFVSGYGTPIEFDVGHEKDKEDWRMALSLCVRLFFF